MKRFTLALAVALLAVASCSSPPAKTGSLSPQALTYTGADVTTPGYQITSASPDVLYVDVATAGGTVTLSSKTGGPGTPQAGMTLVIRDTGGASSMNKIVFTPGSTWTIDGASSADLVTSAGKRRDIRLKAAGAWTTLGGEF